VNGRRHGQHARAEAAAARRLHLVRQQLGLRQRQRVAVGERGLPPAAQAGRLHRLGRDREANKHAVAAAAAAAAGSESHGGEVDVGGGVGGGLALRTEEHGGTGGGDGSAQGLPVHQCGRSVLGRVLGRALDSPAPAPAVASGVGVGVITGGCSEAQQPAARVVGGAGRCCVGLLLRLGRVEASHGPCAAGALGQRQRAPEAQHGPHPPRLDHLLRGAHFGARGRAARNGLGGRPVGLRLGLGRGPLRDHGCRARDRGRRVHLRVRAADGRHRGGIRSLHESLGPLPLLRLVGQRCSGRRYCRRRRRRRGREEAVGALRAAALAAAACVRVRGAGLLSRGARTLDGHAL
jgi:hypothetical protein